MKCYHRTIEELGNTSWSNSVRNGVSQNVHAEHPVVVHRAHFALGDDLSDSLGDGLSDSPSDSFSDSPSDAPVMLWHNANFHPPDPRW